MKKQPFSNLKKKSGYSMFILNPIYCKLEFWIAATIAKLRTISIHILSMINYDQLNKHMYIQNWIILALIFLTKKKPIKITNAYVSNRWSGNQKREEGY